MKTLMILLSSLFLFACGHNDGHDMEKAHDKEMNEVKMDDKKMDAMVESA